MTKDIINTADRINKNIINKYGVLKMPRRDGTGPDGQGTRTGGGRGNCPPRPKK